MTAKTVIVVVMIGNDNHILTLDERAFYIRQSIEGTQRVIQECLTRYKKDGNLDALKIALDANVQLAEMLKKIKEFSSYGHDFDSFHRRAY